MSSFSTEEKKRIEELLETGVTLSADKLGELSNTPWNIVSTSVEEMPVIKMLSLFANDKTPHLAAHLRSRSMLPVELLILFPERSARVVTDAVIKTASESLRKLPDPAKVVIGEIANIMGQSVLRSLANALKISIILNVPELTSGMKSNLLGEAFGNFDGQRETVIFSRIDMSSEHIATECSMAIIVNVELMRRLLRASVAS